MDGRADLYALGCVAYYLLTGRLVFEGASALQVIARHLHETPVPPSRLAEHPIPAEFDELVLRCLAKDPADRPASGRTCRVRSPPSRWISSPGAEQARDWWEHIHSLARSNA